MKRSLWLVASVAIFTLVWFAFGQEVTPTADELLAELSDTLFPDTFEGTITLETFRPDEDPTFTRLRVLRKGSDKVLLEVLNEGTQQGQRILRLEDENLLLFPDICQIISLDSNQPLFGTLFNVGDIARLDLVSDYEPELLGTELIDGRLAYMLNLQSISDKTAYDRVLYWIDVDELLPIKADLFSQSGRLLNSVSYENPIELAGEIRPSKFIMTSELDAGMTVLTIETMEIRDDLSDDLFTEEALLASCEDED